jgi:NAD(P)-dependent dehydrogenase (short-subunit alcohol dehydrogenase family)
MDLPSHYGQTFTPTIHETPYGPTLPTNNKRPYAVVVTGAGKGLGRAIAIAYAQAGATHLCVSSRTQSDLDSLSQDLLSTNPALNLLVHICDTSKSGDVKALAEATKTAFEGRLDVVVANAGVISKYMDDGRLPAGIAEDEDFERVTRINYLGSYYVAKFFVPLLLESKSDIRAYIVISSLAAHVTSSRGITPIAYNVSKLAVNRMVECMANDHGEEGLLAFAVHPGYVLFCGGEEVETDE